MARAKKMIELTVKKDADDRVHGPLHISFQFGPEDRAAAFDSMCRALTTVAVHWNLEQRLAEFGVMVKDAKAYDPKGLPHAP